MSRRSVSLVVVGWLLGLLTAFVWPAVTTEQQTVLVNNAVALNRIRDLVADGWTAGRSDVALGDLRLVTLERPRYLGLVRGAGELLNNAAGWLAWATGTGVYAPRPLAPALGPTEAPKPTLLPPPRSP